MKKYFLLQLKRACRFLPWCLCVVLILFGCMSVVFNAMVVADDQENQSDLTRLKLGVVGTAGDKYLKWGLAALQFDTTALSMNLVAMEEDEAQRALEQGQIAAYLVFPEGFVDSAMDGEVLKVRFVCTVGASGMISIIKEEVTGIVERTVIACEKGSYGVRPALRENGVEGPYGKYIDEMSLEYVEFLFDRSKMYQVETMDAASVPFDRYMLGGLTVVLMLLACLPFAPLYIRADRSLARVLRSRRVGVLTQTASDFGAYFAAMSVLLATVSLVAHFGGLLPAGMPGWKLFFGALPAVLMLTAMTFFMYSLSGHLTSGVLLTFFAILALGYIGGCMYPIHFFPLSVQALAPWLPTGVARVSITACFVGQTAGNIGPLLAYSALFLTATVAVRSYKTGKAGG